MMQKNEEYTLEIIDMGVDGAGIGKIDGIPLFVKDAVIGDTVRVRITKMKKNYGYARMLEILSPSPDRVTPRCPVSRQCGGCQIQALDYKKQLEFKEKKVRDSLERIAGLRNPFLEPIIGMDEPYGFRNKEQFPVRKGKDGLAEAGFFAARTHSLVPVTDCPVGAPVNEEVMKRVLSFLNAYHIEPYNEEEHSGLVRHVLVRYGYTGGQVMVCLILNGENLPHTGELVASLREIEGMTSITVNVNTKKTNVIMGEKLITLWGTPYITDELDGIRFEISPLSFYQVNPRQTEKLYRTALAYAGLTGTETVWDLYCGVGTISLYLSQQAGHVYGVEIVPQAVRDARKNAAENGITNVDFFVGRAEEIVPGFYAGNEKELDGARHPDVMVVDPPRKGCDETLLATMCQMAPERIVYVSCDPATLARDVKYLCANGYQFVKGRPVDQFGHSVHVECVVLMSRVEK